MYIDLSVKYLLFLLQFNECWIFWTYFRKILKYQISWKSVHWETSYSIGRTDGRTDMTNLIVAFHNFANAPKKWRFRRSGMLRRAVWYSTRLSASTTRMLSSYLFVCRCRVTSQKRDLQQGRSEQLKPPKIMVPMQLQLTVNDVMWTPMVCRLIGAGFDDKVSA